MALSYLKYFIFLVVLILVQKTFIWLIALSNLNITPDIVIIAVVYIGIKKGKIEGAIAGFLAGLVIDYLSGSFIGLLALSYSIAGFISGFFKDENDKYLTKYFFLLVVFVCSLIVYFLYFTIYFQGASINFSEIIIKYVFTTSAYTTIISIVYALFLKKKKGY